ncbi:methyltransferase [Streptomyces sp. Amel2xC10]|uniref:methyltransferase n=1 Tax=Streptomyces sp. Amel2xC10 TaxID=1305826 RepID=UPI000A08A725|nr:methyltransferase [Streptomyces sp. Amel2xC10]AZQ05496.1 methyltransferase [synthetic construct]QBN22650.1 methyltransferase [Streptomyces sp.]SMF77054.1 O-methyltransferase [Streptomyces sp. Amel2xC10]
MTAELEFAEAVGGLAPIALRAAATLRMADHIAAGHDTVLSLAERTGTDPDLLGRVLQFLACRGVFTEPSPGTYALTPVSLTLLEGHPSGLREWLDASGVGARMDAAVGDLLGALRSGEPSYPRLHGRAFYEDLALHCRGPAFDSLRHTHAESYVSDLVAAYPWDRARRVVDVGGGTGVLVEALMRAHSTLRTVLVDLPDAVAAATARIAAAGFGDRFTPVTGSFFDPLPGGADVYTLVNVVHNWNDEQASAILRRCAEAGRKDSTFVIVERLVDDSDPRAITAMDLRMFLFLGGKERTAAQIREVARAAGMAYQSMIKTSSGLRLLVFGKKRS